MAGDRGMRFTELNDASLQHLDLPTYVTDGYSTSRTCEIGLSNKSGIDFRSIVYLVDEATTAKSASL
jgi:D-lactate dehydrogenase